LVECKTTEAMKPKDSVSIHHAVQASAYALALGIEQAVVLVKHAKSHIETQYYIKPESYRAMIEARAKIVSENTKPGAVMPQAVPNPLAPWGCSYCDYRMCKSNPQFDAQKEVEF
jgi:hypothetical protein